MKILLRFDDICPTMNWNQWDIAKKIMDKAGVTALLGVIPDCQDPDLKIDEPNLNFWKYIKTLQTEGYAIAMHGYQHVFDIRSSGIVTPKKHSEFAGHPYEIQYEKIRKGKSIMTQHGIETDVFFAPAHSYDSTTLKALAANGFKYISDGMSSMPYERNGINCIPTYPYELVKGEKDSYVTVVLHAHEWVREDKRETWDLFQEICKKNGNSVLSFNDFKEWKSGNGTFQMIKEKGNVIWRCYTKPFLKKIKDKLVQSDGNNK